MLSRISPPPFLPRRDHAQREYEVDAAAEVAGAHGLVLVLPVVGGEGVGHAEHGHDHGQQLDAARGGDVGHSEGAEEADVLQGGDEGGQEEVELQQGLQGGLGGDLYQVGAAGEHLW